MLLQAFNPEDWTLASWAAIPGWLTRCVLPNVLLRGVKSWHASADQTPTMWIVTVHNRRNGAVWPQCAVYQARSIPEHCLSHGLLCIRLLKQICFPVKHSRSNHMCVCVCAAAMMLHATAFRHCLLNGARVNGHPWIRKGQRLGLHCHPIPRAAPTPGMHRCRHPRMANNTHSTIAETPASIYDLPDLYEPAFGFRDVGSEARHHHLTHQAVSPKQTT